MKNDPVVVFDFGGVLVDWNPRYLYRKLFNGNSTAMEKFLADINFYEWNAMQDGGRSFAEGIADLSEQYPHYSALIAAYGERWEESVAGSIPETVEILHTLKQKNFSLYGLTNWSAETFYRILPQYHFFRWFDDIIVSGDVQLVKPDPAIYKILLEEADVPAKKCLLIDDSEANVVAADELGFMTIHFQSPEQLRVELSARGFL